MIRLLPTTLLTLVLTGLATLPAVASERDSMLKAETPAAELTETCTRENRRPIAEVVSRRCTDEEPEHFFVDRLPECDCRLEADADGQAVLRLSLPALAALPVVAARKEPAIQAVFKPESRPLTTRYTF